MIKYPNEFGLVNTNIEEPRSKLRGIFDRKEFCLLLIRSLTPQQATGLALAVRFNTSNYDGKGSGTIPF